MTTQSTHELTVQCKDTSYPIHIGRGLLRALGDYLPASPRRILITDENVAGLYLQQVCQAASIERDECLVFASGEKSKTLENCDKAFQFLLEREVRRDAQIVALGGGVIGDMAGFVAATYMRGIEFVSIPTTLLAQVDSAVGGKTAVNHALGKNMIGAFYQPRCVVTDLDTLETLPEREFHAALAEIIKYGLIMDAEFFAWLEEHLDAVSARDDQALSYAIYRSCELKAQVVAADEHERTGQRALLNFGHTFGHAIETTMGYGEYLHGEAVGCGMVMAAQRSADEGFIDMPTVQRITALIERAQLPIALPDGVDEKALHAAMRRDKKNTTDAIRLILLKQIGAAEICPA